MKLATLRRGGRDGTLIVVDRQLRQAATVPKIARTLQEALENWDEARLRLLDVYERLNAGGIDTSFGLRVDKLAAPLPRVYERLDVRAHPSRDAEAYLVHGSSGSQLGPRDPIPLGDAAAGLDFEPTLAIVTDDVPFGVSTTVAAEHVRLCVLANDLWLRELPGRVASALSPVVATPDELGAAWREGVPRLAVSCEVDGLRLVVSDLCDDMPQGFATLLAHAAKTRALGAGTLLAARPSDPRTEPLRIGNRVLIDVKDTNGQSVFGAIEQTVVAAAIG